MTREQFRPPDHDTDHFLLTTVVGSYPQPEWLDGVRRLEDDGDLTAEQRREAEDDAVRAVVSEFSRAGLDVVTDGEMRREGMVEHFAQFIDGYDASGDGDGWNARMPTVVDTVSSDQPWLVEDFEFARSVSDRPVKTTITGPFTLSSFCSLDGYTSVRNLAGDMSELVADEAGRLVDAGAKWIQIDEPALGMSPHGDLEKQCLEPIADAVPDDVRLTIHICSGNYTDLLPELFEFPVDEVDLEFASEDADDPADIFGDREFDVDVGFGVIDTSSKDVESVEEVKANIREGLSVVPADQFTAVTDCGMKPLTRPAARGKVEALGEAVTEIEQELDAGEIEALA